MFTLNFVVNQPHTTEVIRTLYQRNVELAHNLWLDAEGAALHGRLSKQQFLAHTRHNRRVGDDRGCAETRGTGTAFISLFLLSSYAASRGVGWSRRSAAWVGS